MTQVKNFQDISYDELMDIDGGGTLSAEADGNGGYIRYDGDDWYVEVGYESGRGVYIEAGMSI